MDELLDAVAGFEGGRFPENAVHCLALIGFCLTAKMDPTIWHLVMGIFETTVFVQ